MAGRHRPYPAAAAAGRKDNCIAQPHMPHPQLRITEIFYSLQGETDRVGLPTVFVRLSGCPLRCRYCDTAYAFHGGELLSAHEILHRVAKYRPRYVTVTGGEPLAQPGCLPLLRALCDRGYEVSLETGGALPIDGIDSRVSRVMDIKTPGSGEMERNLPENLRYLCARDRLKFVLCDEADYRWAASLCQQHQLHRLAGEVLFSPVWGELEPQQLAEWILRDGLPVRMQLQLHKILWGDTPGK